MGRLAPEQVESFLASVGEQLQLLHMMLSHAGM